MISERAHDHQEPRLVGRIEDEPAPRSARGALRLFTIRLINYLTNHVVCHIPSFAMRRLWYRRVLGVRFGTQRGRPPGLLHLVLWSRSAASRTV